jgi:hypothetical protein
MAKAVDSVFDDLTDHELAEWANIELAYDMMPDSVDLANYDIHMDADEYDDTFRTQTIRRRTESK